jgi:predicted DNA-binding ribbon-helix-helix protein
MIKKRSINIAGRKTAVSLEDQFWESFREIAGKRGKTLRQMIADIDAERKSSNLSSAIRLFVLRYYRDQPDQQSDERAASLVAQDLSNAIEHGAR